MIDIIQAVNELKTKRIEQYPVKSNRASQMGHPCERFLVYERTRWSEKSMHDLGLQYLFDEGRLHEQAVLKELSEAGIHVIEQQRSFEWKEYNITGHIDGKILHNGMVYPLEIKSMSHWIWQSINSVEDMAKSKMVYMKQYPAQIQLYLIMDEEETGIFVLKNKQSGLLKQISVNLDYEYTEGLLKKAERINDHVANSTLPDRIPVEVGACDWCAYQHICLPSGIHEGTLVEDPELEAKLERREILKQSFDEYNDIDKEIKDSCRQKPEIIVGNWQITGKMVEKKGYEVKPFSFWQTTIKKLVK